MHMRAYVASIAANETQCLILWAIYTPLASSLLVPLNWPN